MYSHAHTHTHMHIHKMHTAHSAHTHMHIHKMHTRTHGTHTHALYPTHPPHTHMHTCTHTTHMHSYTHTHTHTHTIHTHSYTVSLPCSWGLFPVTPARHQVNFVLEDFQCSFVLLLMLMYGHSHYCFYICYRFAVAWWYLFPSNSSILTLVEQNWLCYRSWLHDISGWVLIGNIGPDYEFRFCANWKHLILGWHWLEILWLIPDWCELESVTNTNIKYIESANNKEILIIYSRMLYMPQIHVTKQVLHTVQDTL